MKKLLQNSMDLVGEFTGLRQRDWDAVRQAQFEGIKKDIARASGLVALNAMHRGDIETAQLERKIFLHDIAGTGSEDSALSMTQRAAQEVLDEVYAQNISV
jgi:hypothetical protein